MKVMVTGGAGYVGSHVVAALLAGGHDVVVFDNLSTGFRATVPAAAQLVVGDLDDATAIQDTLMMQRVEAVIHCAGSIEAGESMRDPGKFYRNNVVNSIHLLDGMVRAGVRNIVFSSSAGVYGNPARVPIVEIDPVVPVNTYGETKLAIERAMHWYGQAHDLRWIALRYFNAAGATDRLGEAHRPESHLIPLVLQVALGQRPRVSIFGTDYPTPDGTAIRDYVHVADLADAHALALPTLERGSAIYNLGSGTGFSVRQVVETARAITGHPIPTADEPRRPGDPAALVADSARITADLGWRPRYGDLGTIVETAWKWHVAHPTGY